VLQQAWEKLEVEECCNELEEKEVLQRERERLDTKWCCNEDGRSWRKNVATSKKRGVATRMGKARHEGVLQRECDKPEDECCNEQEKGKGEGRAKRCCNQGTRLETCCNGMGKSNEIEQAHDEELQQEGGGPGEDVLQQGTSLDVMNWGCCEGMLQRAVVSERHVAMRRGKAVKDVLQ
jgi:hypothetical protein